MKISIIIMAVCLGVFFSGPASAQMHNDQSGDMPMNMEMMQDHMRSMADMMSEMAAAMQKGKMTPEQQTQCGAFIQRLSAMMHDMAADPKQEKISQRQGNMQEIKKEWDYWSKEQQLYGH
jgi:hypothetical protein